MSKYGPGILLSKALMLDKERIKHALKGELLVSEDEDGFVYAPASKEECDKFIIGAFDNAAYHALKLAASGRALEKLAGEIRHEEYMKVVEEENLKYNEYVYDESDD